MSDLQLHLLGTFQILQNGRSLTTFRTNKIRALLAYLAVEADHPHRRDSLAALFWPQMDNRNALTNLRLSLHRLRQALGDDPPVLRIDRYTVQWHASAARIDAAVFAQTLTAVTAHDHALLCPDCARRLETAVPHYKGDFLAGFFLEDAAPFDDWAATRRERLHQQALQALAWLAAFHQENGRYPQAILHTRRQLELEPWREPAHRQMMQLLAATGQHTAALRQYEQCRRLLRDELGATPEAATTDLYRQIQAERTAASAHGKSDSQPLPLSPAQRITVFLPATAAPLVGRQAEMTQLDQLMSHPATRLVTITGVGGMGKTRLALTWSAAQAAHQPQHFPHGIYFVPLTAVHTTAHLVPAIVQALPFVPDDASTQPLPQQLDDYLRDRQLLLVLDNFEQLLTRDDGAAVTAVLHHLLDHAPQLKLLVTSREHLHLQNEQPLPLNGLPCPGDQETEWAQFPAAQLFAQSARRVQADFALTPPDRPHLIAICRLLGGIPLALELAAAWVEWLPLADIAAEIGRSLDFLAADQRDWPERHRSMRAIFDSAWARLSRPEQTFFTRLCLFRGGFTRAAALAVAGDGQPRPTVLRLLAALVQKSLLRYDRLAERYTMHDLLQQYGGEKLAQAAALSDIQQAHAVYFCRWLGQEAPLLKGAQQKAALHHILADLDNIRAAWTWAVQASSLPLLAEAAAGLGLFLLRNGRFPDGAALFGDAVRHFPAQTATPDECLALAWLRCWQAAFEPSLPQRQEMLEQGLALLPATAAENNVRVVKAAILLELGSVARSQGRQEAVDQLLGQSLALYRLSDDRWGEANVLYELGVYTWRQGEYPLSEQWFNHCLQLRQSLGDGDGTAVALEGLAGTALFSGRAEEAHRLLQQCAPLYRELDDPVGVARVKIKQAQVSWYLDLTGLAQFAEGLDSLRALGERRHVALWTVIYAMLQADEDINLAAQNATAGLALCRELGLLRGVAIAQGVLSRVALVNGRYAEAQERAEAYLQTAQALSLSVEYVDALVWAGWAALACGDEARAGWCAAQALQIPNYWRVACLGLTAVLLARRSADNYEWAWQILGYGESCYARLRSPISQEILVRFLPQAMQQMLPVRIHRCKKQGHRLDETTIERLFQTARA
jgi:predicted ATPase/DNA-binding SARP family transcriptional activator